MSTPTRRQFVAAAAGAACVCAGCPLLAAAVERRNRPVNVGKLTDFDHDGVYDSWAGDGFFVVRRGGKLYAVSSHCTHRKVKLVVAKGDGFKCPRHGSTFDADGRVTKSPARKSLPRFGIRVDGSGNVVVDGSDDRGGFVSLDQAR